MLYVKSLNKDLKNQNEKYFSSFTKQLVDTRQELFEIDEKLILTQSDLKREKLKVKVNIKILLHYMYYLIFKNNFTKGFRLFINFFWIFLLIGIVSFLFSQISNTKIIKKNENFQLNILNDSESIDQFISNDIINLTLSYCYT